MKSIFKNVILEHKKILSEFEKKKDIVEKIASEIILCIKNGNKLLICGNGGSAADSQHLASEFVGRFTKERMGYPAIALTTDTSILTSLSNDYSFYRVFERQVEAIGKKGDILVGFSTSGNSKNIISAFEIAKRIGIKTIGILGKKGKIAKLCDIFFDIDGTTARVQEIHSILIHVICEIVEDEIG